MQEELERALRTVLGERGHDGEPLTLTVAGRTDRGVHAWGQVASYAHEAVDPLRLNGLLDDDVAVLAAEPAPEGFDARRDASSRTYCYRVLARRTRSVFERERAFWWPAPARPRRARSECAARAARHARLHRVHADRDRALATSAAACIAPSGASDGELLEFWIEADMFLRHMNRVLVGTMLDVAAGRRTLEEFARAARGAAAREAGQDRARARAGAGERLLRVTAHALQRRGSRDLHAPGPKRPLCWTEQCSTCC